jgi:hypothetical protein
VVSGIEADEKSIRIIGNKDILQASLPGNRPQMKMCVVLYANGAPWPITA